MLIVICFTEDFNDIGKGGLFYMFLSLKNYFLWMSQLSIELDQQMSSISDSSVPTMRKALRISGSPPAELNVLSILSAAFTIASGPTAPLAPVAGYFAGTAGLFSMVLLSVPAPFHPTIQSMLRARLEL